MDNLLIGSAMHLEMLGGLRQLEYLMLNLPYSCNYNCSKCCNSSRGISTGDVISAGYPLSLVEIQRLITEAVDLGIRVLVIAGEGEPFLDANLEDIIASADKAGLIPYIFTNGSRLIGNMPQFLRRHNASLVINMDSLQKQVYEQLVGVEGSFDAVYENLETVRKNFADAYSQIQSYGLRRVAINTVVSHQNIDELQKIKEFCGDDFALVFNVPMNIGRAYNNSLFMDAKPTIKTIPLGTTSDSNWCAYMRNGISVGANGDILVCAYSLESAGLLGNIREEGLIHHVGRANAKVDAFYAVNGHSRCILRHPTYKEFITGLNS